MKATPLGKEVAFMAEPSTDEVRREKAKSASQKWREAHPEQVRENERRYRERNKEKIRERRRRYRQEHKEEIREYVRRSRAADPEKFRQRTRQWQAENPERVREYNRSRAPLRAAMATNHGRNWREAYAALWDAQDGRCYLCGRELQEDATYGRGGAVVIDHDHRCCPPRRSCDYCRRGLACHPCNRAIGLLNDDPELLRRVADALEATLARVDKRLSQRVSQGELF